MYCNVTYGEGTVVCRAGLGFILPEEAQSAEIQNVIMCGVCRFFNKEVDFTSDGLPYIAGEEPPSNSYRYVRE